MFDRSIRIEPDALFSSLVFGCRHKTSSIRSLTRSHPRNLLSIARLKRARSRFWFASWSRTRMVQTSLGLSGRFCPIRWPLFQGNRFSGEVVWI